MYQPKLEYYLINAENSVFFPTHEDLMKKVKNPVWIAKLAAWHQGIEHFITKDEWKKLEKSGIVKKFRLSEDEVVKIIKMKKPQILSDHQKKCEWCQGSTCILHAHHYPKSKKEGGQETVNICPSCHCEFHYLITENNYKIKEEYEKYFEDAKKQKFRIIEYKKLLDKKDPKTTEYSNINFKMYIEDMIDERNDHILP